MDGLTVFYDFLTFVGRFAPLFCIVVVLFYAGGLLERKDK
ncbi:Uncharacterised protein [Streptococcus pneumoniae]|nr:Uncharacterised protein [Streptococcus pneumoniae]CJC76519.1 Uncharacterised protein [Streptococcus pneumoniae]CJH88124.1 Uncharacterised protein [Streptococcus pneumoniae]CJK35459.1 Uncharacterised protein [Streptococcus pneumoniae]CJK49733.1 Uncharacterised protein [Streptococcus pneumoniae]